MRILIVDDATTARLFTQKCLTSIGFHDAEFIKAANGKEALAKARQQPPDLILTDLMMPEMDGESLLRELKNDPDLQGIPVVVISSAGNEARRDALIDLGAKDVVAKPFSTTEIYEVLKEYVTDMEGDDGWG